MVFFVGDKVFKVVFVRNLGIDFVFGCLLVADPGFPIGGVWTSDTGTFRQKCMQK